MIKFKKKIDLPKKKKASEELVKLKKWYSEQLRRKDAEIERLKKENKMIMATALKRAAHSDQLNQELLQLREEISKKRKL